MVSQSPILTIARFDQPTDAHLARAALEAEGIEAIVVNDGVVNLTIYNALPLHAVQLQVRAGDAEAACKLLGIERTELTASDPASAVQAMKCPQCGFTMERIPHAPLGALVNAIRSLYDPALARRRWRCRACGHQMNQ